MNNSFNLLFKPEGSFRRLAVSPPTIKYKFSETGGSVYEIFLLVVFFALRPSFSPSCLCGLSFEYEKNGQSRR